ncbi:MAG: hypothetical protein JXM69_11900 [Anaerolineae bacterium]|nr:hypothetical protein [Anaerolineae bacterium]
MKRLLDIISDFENMPWRKALLFWFVLAVMAAGGLILWVLPRTLERLQSNSFDLFGDLLVVGMAFVLWSLLIFGCFLAGHFLGWLSWRMFEIAPEAMLQVQSWSALVTAISPEFYVPPVQIPKNLQVSPNRLFEQRFSFQSITRFLGLNHSLPIVIPHPSLPYRLFPVSCILLN